MGHVVGIPVLCRDRIVTGTSLVNHTSKQQVAVSHLIASTSLSLSLFSFLNHPFWLLCLKLTGLPVTLSVNLIWLSNCFSVQADLIYYISAVESYSAIVLLLSQKQPESQWRERSHTLDCS